MEQSTINPTGIELPTVDPKVPVVDSIMKQVDITPIKGSMSQLNKGIDPAIQKLTENADPELIAKADEYVKVLIGDSWDRQQKRVAIDEFGINSQKVASQSSSMLRAPLKALYRKSTLPKAEGFSFFKKKSADGGEGKNVGEAVTDLQMMMLEMEPTKFGLGIQQFKALLGKSAIGKKIVKYYTKCNSMQAAIDSIVTCIENGSLQLQRDNEAYADSQETLRIATVNLKKYIQLAMLIDARLQLKLSEIKEPEEKKFVQQELLFPIRKRVMSLQQTLLANQQSIMTSEIMINTNRELIRATNDARYISVVQLQTVMGLILGLYNQRDQLTRIKALNATTESLMNYGAELLDTQAAEIGNLASEVMISMETLENCMNHIHSAFEKIDTFRQNALPQMAEHVVKMEEMTTFNDKEMQKRERGATARSSVKLSI